MKQYLWVGIALLFVNANAAGFGDIDRETDSFLSDLRGASGSDDEFGDDDDLLDDVFALFHLRLASFRITNEMPRMPV